MSFVKGQMVKVRALTDLEISEYHPNISGGYLKNVKELSDGIAICMGEPGSSEGHSYHKYKFVGAARALQKKSYQHYIHDFFFELHSPAPPPEIKSVVIRHGKIEEEP